MGILNIPPNWFVVGHKKLAINSVFRSSLRIIHKILAGPKKLRNGFRFFYFTFVFVHNNSDFGQGRIIK